MGFVSNWNILKTTARLGAVFCLSLFLGSSAFATCRQRAPTREEFSQNPGKGLGCFIDGENFFAHGPIDASFSADLQAALQSGIPVKRVILSSPGGVYEMGLRFGRLIREAGLETVVPMEKTYCTSSCTYVFQSGVVRTAHPQALFGYHATSAGGEALGQIYLRDCGPGPVYLRSSCAKDIEDMHQISLQGAHTVFQNLEALGVSPELGARYLNQPEDPQWMEHGEFTRVPVLHLRARELVQYGVVQNLNANFPVPIN